VYGPGYFSSQKTHTTIANSKIQKVEEGTRRFWMVEEEIQGGSRGRLRGGKGKVSENGFSDLFVVPHLCSSLR
jgi:hypothetical protein